MTTQNVVATVMAVLLVGLPGSAQSAADLLQKGIHAQETAGDLESAIKIFRQVAGSASSNKLLAAQAQYQLVVCMLQKGDRTAAQTEYETLAKNFPEQQDLVSKARKLLPGAATLLPAPWDSVSEASQLNIKRDGVFTGEYLFYSADVAHTASGPFGQTKPDPNQLELTWELHTKATTRSSRVRVDRASMQSLGQPDLTSNDDLGDETARPFSGPAIDVEASIFWMRRLPLAMGFKTTISSLPFVLGEGGPKQVELAVTGVEAVQVPEGRYRCYKVSAARLGQTFWIGIEGAKPLVKFQSENVEAELVKTWAGGNLLETALAGFGGAGWEVKVSPRQVGATLGADVRYQKSGNFVGVRMRKVYTPAADIPQALREAMKKSVASRTGERRLTVRSNSVQERVIDGRQALDCVADRVGESERTEYFVWIQSESALIEFNWSTPYNYFATFRWRFDPLLATVRIP